MSENILQISFDVSNENIIDLREKIKHFLIKNQIQYYNFRIYKINKTIKELKSE